MLTETFIREFKKNPNLIRDLVRIVHEFDNPRTLLKDDCNYCDVLDQALYIYVNGELVERNIADYAVECMHFLDMSCSGCAYSKCMWEIEDINLEELTNIVKEQFPLEEKLDMLNL